MASNWPLTDLLDRLSEATLIHVDARVLALYMLGDEVLGPQVETIMRVAGSGVLNVQTTALTLYQILAEVYRRGRAALAGNAARSGMRRRLCRQDRGSKRLMKRINYHVPEKS